jgi:invasion protein IalB
MREIPFAAERRIARNTAIYASFVALALALPAAADAQQQATPVLLDAMTTELHRAFTSLGKQGDDKQLTCRYESATPGWITRTGFIAARRYTASNCR